MLQTPQEEQNTGTITQGKRTNILANLYGNLLPSIPQ